LWRVWEKSSGAGLFSLGRATAVGAGAPKNNFRFVDHEAVGVFGVEAGGFSGGAFDVLGFSARAADEVVVVVVDAVFVERRRTRGLDTADKTLGDEHPKNVVNGLARDGAQVLARVLGDGVGGAMRIRGEGAHDSEALGGHGDAAFAELVGGRFHWADVFGVLDSVKNWRVSIYAQSKGAEWPPGFFHRGDAESAESQRFSNGVF
jgi:hypothetical protein